MKGYRNCARKGLLAQPDVTAPGRLLPEVVLVTVLGGDDLGVLFTRDVLVADGGDFVFAHSSVKLCSLWCFSAGHTSLSSQLPLVDRLQSGVLYPDASH